MVLALNLLLSTDIIKNVEHAKRMKLVEEFYSRAKAERKSSKPKTVRPKGRPQASAVQTFCRRDGCNLPASNGYCCREHAPLGSFGMIAFEYEDTE